MGDWVIRFKTNGVAGLLVQAGRGRKPAFPPQAKADLLEQVRRVPNSYNIERSRWTLKLIRDVSLWMRNDLSLGAVHGILSRLGICWKRARSYVHSPDPSYDAKTGQIERIRAQVNEDPNRFVLLYLDEVTIERHPSICHDYEQRGASIQPLARRSHQKNTLTRFVGSMNAVTGAVTYRQAAHITLNILVSHYQDICKIYPNAKTIFVVQDNWPVHVHPDVLCALEPQSYSALFRYPASWSMTPTPKAIRNWSALNLPIQIVPLPTYASWLNPIEKLWRWMRQDIAHNHRLADDLVALRKRLTTWLDGFEHGSLDLLRYVGLYPV